MGECERGLHHAYVDFVGRILVGCSHGPIVVGVYIQIGMQLWEGATIVILIRKELEAIAEDKPILVSRRIQHVGVELDEGKFEFAIVLSIDHRPQIKINFLAVLRNG